MTGNGPRTVQSYIIGDAAAKARQAEMLRKQLSPFWEQVAGADLARHSYPVRLDGTTLLIHADAALWANRIRHRYSDYVQGLQRFPELRRLKDLKVRIVPIRSVEPPRPSTTERPQLSGDAGKVIEGVAQGITDDKLREALLRLSRRAK
jgi:hypothetical protein